MYKRQGWPLGQHKVQRHAGVGGGGGDSGGRARGYIPHRDGWGGSGQPSRPGDALDALGASRSSRPGDTLAALRSSWPGDALDALRSSRPGDTLAALRSSRSGDALAALRSGRPGDALDALRSSRPGDTLDAFRSSRPGRPGKTGQPLGAGGADFSGRAGWSHWSLLPHRTGAAALSLRTLWAGFTL